MVDGKDRGGFTLLELMLVIAIMAVLGGVIVGSVRYVTRIARDKRAQVTAQVLETALARYRAEYNKWPGLSDTSDVGKTNIVFKGPDNKRVFGALRETSKKDNPKGIRFLDESTIFTAKAEDDQLVLLSATEGDQPLAFANRNTSKARFFQVTINAEKDTVAVEATSKDLNDFSEDDDFRD